jgi:Probable cobalt transporter subunit (CbtA)
MVRALLIRGMLAGLLAGVLGFIYAHQFGESAIETAIAFESYVEYDVHHDAPEVELVSREVQSTAGLGTGTLIYGAAFGGIFALAFAAAYGRIGPFAARGTAAIVGVLGFTAVYLVPFLKFPPNPPSIGDPDTIQYRTAMYVLLVATSVVAIVFCVNLQRRLAVQFGGWNATLLAAAAYVLVLGVCFLAFPGINEVPQAAIPNVVDAVTEDDVTFPPTVLWSFRMASLGLQVVMWTTIALVFGVLAERLLERSAVRPTGVRKRSVSSPVG